MPIPRIAQIPYRGNSSELFAAVSSEAWAMWLDSCGQGDELGRYDIIVARPYRTLVTRGERTELHDEGGSRYSDEDPFTLLRRELGPPSESLAELPFSGGALGYFAYDLGRRIERLPQRAVDDLAMPEMALGLYDWALVCDHQERRCWLASQGRHPSTARQWPALLALFSRTPPAATTVPLHACGELRSNLTPQAYAQAFRRIQHYLREGDCYQVNFAQRFSLPVEGDPFAAYRILRQRNPAPFAAYLNTPFGQILSCSPERFLKVTAGQVETRPIKGTRPRRDDPRRDAQLAQELVSSIKDRAENLMIVDLLRNDLGKNCRPGTIRVPHLFTVEHYATVHHLVSVVTGELREGSDALTLLRDSFPGGSITGAPKRRAMEIIEELEPHRRGVYCGSIGYIGYDGTMDTNIAIRTALHHQGMLYLSAGGGIVTDSDCATEYQETRDKAAGVLRIFGEWLDDKTLIPAREPT